MITTRIFPLLLLAFLQVAKTQTVNEINNDLFTTNNSLSDVKRDLSGNMAEKKVLIIVDGGFELQSVAIVEGKQLENLLGHFRTSITLLAVNQYSAHIIDHYDIIFYIGLQLKSQASPSLMNDIFNSKKTVVWMNSGIFEFEKRKDIRTKYGFSVNSIDSSNNYNAVKSGKKTFTRKDDNLFVIQISNTKKVAVLATANSDESGKETPYIVRSGNFYYVADVPLVNATETDRYLLFADLLHEIVGENHPECHRAIVRIEDVTPLRTPGDLYNIADILSSHNIPFLVGIVPFYVNPEEGINVSLSDRPELVKAVRYCIKKGATIVLHGITHQYKGISALDYEFWDGETDKPIANQTPQEISKKIEAGINECTKNSIYPLLWETPHYAASIAAYQTISKYFSTSIERRMVGEDEDDGQFFPFLIAKDIYGQKIFPENLGYLPTFQQRDSFELCINQMIETAKAIYNVRDGYASFYFHTHLSSTDYLRQIVEGISSLGFSFVDLRQETNWVKTKDKIILSGSQSYTMNLDHSFLSEIYYDQHGEIKKYIISNRNFTGNISKRINLKPDEIYIAEPLKNPISVVSDRNKNKINSLVNHRNAALN